LRTSATVAQPAPWHKHSTPQQVTQQQAAPTQQRLQHTPCISSCLSRLPPPIRALLNSNSAPPSRHLPCGPPASGPPPKKRPRSPQSITHSASTLNRYLSSKIMRSRTQEKRCTRPPANTSACRGGVSDAQVTRTRRQQQQGQQHCQRQQPRRCAGRATHCFSCCCSSQDSTADTHSLTAHSSTPNSSTQTPPPWSYLQADVLGQGCGAQPHSACCLSHVCRQPHTRGSCHGFSLQDSSNDSMAAINYCRCSS
jgi:hypothetical protein